MKKSIFIPSLIILYVLGTRNGFAQQTEVETRVSQIAGTTVYLELGRDDGLAAGDSLFIYRDSRYLGLLIVENLSSTTLSARYGDERLFPLTRGQIVSVRFTPPLQDETKTGGRPDTTRHSIMTPTTRRPPTPSLRPNVSGRFMTGTSVLYSQTQWGELIHRTTDRTYLSPFSNLNLAIQNLPYGFSADAAISYSYRYSSSQPIHPDHYARFYRLNIEKTFSSLPLSLSAGRFYNRYDVFSGFWDGIMMRLGNRQQGLGIIGGFEPLRGDEGFSSDLPKYSFFVYKEMNISGLRSNTELSFNTVLPSTDLQNHLFAGMYQQFWVGRSRITVNLQADQNPVTDQWLLSQTLVRGVLALTQRWELHGAYNRRQPYRIYFPGNPIGYERTQISGGVGYRLPSGYLGGDVTFNDSKVEAPSRSILAYASVSKSRFWDLSYTANLNYWEGDWGHTLRIAPGLSRYFGEVNLRLGYQFYESEFIGNLNQTHGGEFSVMAPFFDRWYLNAQLRSEIGNLFVNNSLYVSIWRAF